MSSQNEKQSNILDAFKIISENSEDVSQLNLAEMISDKDRDEILQSQGTEIKTLTATSGNFTGELQVEFVWYNDRFYCQSRRYRITRRNGQSGGNKAVLEFNFGSFGPGGERFEYKSGNHLQQDGRWHTFSWGTSVGGASEAVMVFARFTFDSPGSNPRAADFFYSYK